MTVKELIEALQKLPPDLVVWHEGCDCYGEADKVEIRLEGEKKPWCMITRKFS